MQIAVTAASGQLGNAILKELSSQVGPENLTALARTPHKVNFPGITVFEGDYNNKSHFLEGLKGVDVVLIVSGMDHPEQRIGQHRNIIEAAKESGVRKIVYTSIIGKEGSSSFDAIVKSNRQTEKDIRVSGLEWAIGRNGLYIEPDVEYLDQYIKDGKIFNCAGEGLCSYTTRSELAYAYSQLILNDDRNGKIFNLSCAPLTQQQLTKYLNDTFQTNLVYDAVSPEEYLAFQKEVNGEFLGTVIAGIYTKIKNGEFNVDSDFEAATGRKHQEWAEYFGNLK